MLLVQIFFGLLAIYTLIGVLFAIPFIIRGVREVDEAAEESSWKFRLMILPGTVAFWPVLLRKWVKNA